MMRIFLICVLGAAGLGGCAIIPTSYEPGWTDVTLETGGQGAAPAFIAEKRMADTEFSVLATRERLVLGAGDTVRLTGEALRRLSPDSEAYAAEARERARPPQ